MADIHLINAEIILEENKTRYQIGDYIHGKLIITLKGELSLSMVKIGLICLAKLKLVESSNRYKDTNMCLNKHTYLNQTYEMPSEIYGKILRRGTHEIPFKFQLPESGIPSSFESIHGCICYYIECIIEEQDDTHRSGIEIIVEAPIRDNLLISVGGSSEKDLGILCFGSGKVFIDATLFKKGYIAGETMEIQCTVTNSSTVSVTPRATFYQTQIYMSGERHKTIETLVSEPVTGSMVESGTSQQEVLSIAIQQDLPLSLKSPIITIKYFIHVTLDIPHTIDLHINLPIVITNKYALTTAS